MEIDFRLLLRFTRQENRSALQIVDPYRLPGKIETLTHFDTTKIPYALLK